MRRINDGFIVEFKRPVLFLIFRQPLFVNAVCDDFNISGLSWITLVKSMVKPNARNIRKNVTRMHVMRTIISVFFFWDLFKPTEQGHLHFIGYQRGESPHTRPAKVVCRWAILVFV